MKYSIILLILISVTGCSTVSTTARPDSYYQPQNNPPPPNFSLFGDTQGGLDDEAIQKILSYRLVLPPLNRIAILNLSQNNYGRYYSSNFAQLDTAAAVGLANQLKESNRVYDASYLPSFLIPDIKTLPHLRTAAARYQADLLLTYQSRCQSFEKYKLIDPDVTRAYCTVEAIAIDIRSGIVSFTSLSTNELTVQKNASDFNFKETRKKAELNAINTGLKEIASELSKFINDMPVL